MDKYFLLLIILGSLITLIIDILIRKRHQIEFSIHIYRPVNNTHKWLEIILFIVFIITIFAVPFIFSYEATFVTLFGFLTILSSIRAYMEYKEGLKEEKKYITNFVWAVGDCVIFLVTLVYIF